MRAEGSCGCSRFSGPACPAPGAAALPGAGRAQVCPGAAPCTELLREQPAFACAITLHMANCVISLEDLCLVIGLS